MKDIVRCIDNAHGGCIDLTVGRNYEVVKITEHDIYIIDDRGDTTPFLSFRFKLLNREEKLKRILQ